MARCGQGPGPPPAGHAAAGYDLREATLQACADAGVTPRFAVEGGEMDAVLRFVEAGSGVAVVPDLVFAGRPRLAARR